jgi:hypothetical protein
MSNPELEEFSFNEIEAISPEFKKKRRVSAGGISSSGVSSVSNKKNKNQKLFQRILSNLCHSLAINEETCFVTDLKRFRNIIEDFKGSNKNKKLDNDTGIDQATLYL